MGHWSPASIKHNTSTSVRITPQQILVFNNTEWTAARIVIMTTQCGCSKGGSRRRLPPEQSHCRCSSNATNATRFSESNAFSW
mmetsp:Transcript_18182/g.25504  ORF Transcript_18182/g.25504 Transcript_18182/m.25504 type:complete len:83 (+) Transcript_18182:966-1214(+)